MIRLVKPADAAAVLAIYAPYVRDTSITFETEVPTEAEMQERIMHYSENWPWLVVEAEGRVVGYAYASRYRERVAYQWSVECSVYIHVEHMRAGLAGKLYTKLFSLLKMQGFTTVYAVINLPNDRSVLFHEKMGFRYFATYEKVGYKLGQWKNVGWWQLQLNNYIDEPASPIIFAKSNSEVVKSILLQA
jgi:phosphinothricin acetyltransferase